MNEALSDLIIMNNPDVAIWDFDGTIVNSEPYQEEGWRHVFTSREIDFPEDFFDAFIGSDIRQIEEYVHNNIVSLRKDEIFDYTLAKNIWLAENLLKNKPNNFVLPSIKRLQEINTKLILVSNGAYSFINKYLSHHDLSSAFPDIRTTKNVHQFVKKDQVKLICEQYKQAIIFEDSTKYLRTAKDKGAVTVGIKHEYNDITYSDADLIINTDK